MSPLSNHPDELISASLTGDLTDVERRQLETHLAECPECRETLEAFRHQRDLLSGLAQPPMPRDLGARVRAGVESDASLPWWRRPATILAGVGSLATVAAALLLVVFIVNRPSGPPAGRESASPSTTSAPASVVATASTTPTVTPAPRPLDLQPGDLAYLTLTGPKESRTLVIVRDATGDSLTPTNPSAYGWQQPHAAALSPDGRALAFATLLDPKGSMLVFVTDLATGRTDQLGETLPQSFGGRLLWSPDGRYLAFTLEPLAGSFRSDVWIYDRTTGRTSQATASGNAYAASWGPVASGKETLWISLGAADPQSVAVRFAADGGVPSGNLLATATDASPGAFLPLLSPDGQHAIFWRGTMTRDGESGWVFSTGGMPQLTTVGSAGLPAWDAAEPLFSDLQVAQGGQAFASGQVRWAADSDAYVFWAGQWTGTPEGNGYPDANGVYAGRASVAALSQGSALSIGGLKTPEGNTMSVIDVGLSPDGRTAAVTILYPTPGFGAAAYLRTTATSGGKPTDVGSGGLTPPPWLGPGVYATGGATP